MPSAGFEPNIAAIKRLQTLAFDHTASVIGNQLVWSDQRGWGGEACAAPRGKYIVQEHLNERDWLEEVRWQNENTKINLQEQDGWL
jgi:hypothetical protein